MMTPCAVDGCDAVAIVFPVVEIPFAGRAFGSHIPLRIVIPLGHCAEHARGVLPSEFLERGILRLHAERLALASHFIADWLRARIAWMPIERHQDFSLRHTNGGNKA